MCLMKIPVYTFRTIKWVDKSVGIADFRIDRLGLYVLIDEKDANGKLMFPYKYYCSYDLFLKSPVNVVKGKTVRNVPIEAMRKEKR